MRESSEVVYCSSKSSMGTSIKYCYLACFACRFATLDIGQKQLGVKLSIEACSSAKLFNADELSMYGS